MPVQGLARRDFLRFSWRPFLASWLLSGCAHDASMLGAEDHSGALDTTVSFAIGRAEPGGAAESETTSSGDVHTWRVRKCRQCPGIMMMFIVDWHLTRIRRRTSTVAGFDRGRGGPFGPPLPRSKLQDEGLSTDG